MASIRESLRELVNALRGISAYSSQTTNPGPNLADPNVISARKALGGALEPLPQTRLRWYPPDVEKAQKLADTGDMLLIGMLNQSMRIDGTYRGLLDARTSAITLPKTFTGSKEVIRVLESKNYSDRNVFEEMFPMAEQRLIVGDGEVCGVGVGQMCKVQGRNFPVLVRRYVQNLKYIWSQDQWYYRATAGFIPINPGIPDENGEWWILHMPGGRLSPWNNGLWNTCSRSYINKTQSIFARQSWEMKHAHPARVAFSPVGATEVDRAGMLKAIIRWALNAAFDLPVGWDIKLVESNGRGFEIYERSISTADKEMATALCGSAVMLEGTVGFGNNEMFRVVQKDIIRSQCNGWDHTINTQGLPPFIGMKWGVDELQNATTLTTNTAEPAENTVAANTIATLANAIKGMTEALAASQVASGTKKPVALDVEHLLREFGVRVLPTTVNPKEVTGPEAGGEAGKDEETPAKKPGEPGPAKTVKATLPTRDLRHAALCIVRREQVQKLMVEGEEGEEDTEVEISGGRPQYLCVTREESGEFAIPGGHIGEGEDSAKAAIRELAEECGVTISDVRPLGFLTSPVDGCTVYVYEAVSGDWGNARALEAGSQVAWLTADQLLGQAKLFRASVLNMVGAGWLT